MINKITFKQTVNKDFLAPLTLADIKSSPTTTSNIPSVTVNKDSFVPAQAAEQPKKSNKWKWVGALAFVGIAVYAAVKHANTKEIREFTDKYIHLAVDKTDDFIVSGKKVITNLLTEAKHTSIAGKETKETDGIAATIYETIFKKGELDVVDPMADLLYDIKEKLKPTFQALAHAKKSEGLELSETTAAKIIETIKETKDGKSFFSEVLDKALNSQIDRDDVIKAANELGKTVAK
jgi:hypothetical protein